LLSKKAEKSTLWINSRSILAQFRPQSREEKNPTSGYQFFSEILPVLVCLNPIFSAEEPRVRLSVLKGQGSRFEVTAHRRPRLRRKAPDGGVRAEGSIKSAKGDA
jgi:hypothetical protein